MIKTECLLAEHSVFMLRNFRMCLDKERNSSIISALFFIQFCKIEKYFSVL